MLLLQSKLIRVLQAREGFGACRPFLRVAIGGACFSEQPEQRVPSGREQSDEAGGKASWKARRGRIWWERWKQGFFGENTKMRKECFERVEARDATNNNDSKLRLSSSEKNDPSAASELLKDRQLKAIQLQARDPRNAFHVALRRTELSAETGLAIRDLRAIDPSFHNQIATIRARKASIIVNLAHVKAIVTADRVYIFNFLDDRVWQRLLPNLQARLTSSQSRACTGARARRSESCAEAEGASTLADLQQQGAGTREPLNPRDEGETFCCERGLEDDRCPPQGDAGCEAVCHEEDEEIVREQGPFLADQDGERVAVSEPQAVAPRAGEAPFEFQMLETMLESADRALWERFMATVPDTLDILKKFVKDENDVVMEDQRRLLSLRNRLVRFGMEVNQIRAAFHDLLANDEDMAEMYLTRKVLQGGQVRKDQHSEVEELLEDYYKRVEEVANEVQTLLTTIDVTGEYLRTVLDSSRNKLIRLDVMINMATCSLAAGGTITGIFGMNLISTMEDNRLAFAFVTTGVFCTTTLAFGMLLNFARKRRIL